MPIPEHVRKVRELLKKKFESYDYEVKGDILPEEGKVVLGYTLLFRSIPDVPIKKIKEHLEDKVKEIKKEIKEMFNAKEVGEDLRIADKNVVKITADYVTGDA